MEGSIPQFHTSTRGSPSLRVALFFSPPADDLSISPADDSPCSDWSQGDFHTFISVLTFCEPTATSNNRNRSVPEATRGSRGGGAGKCEGKNGIRRITSLPRALLFWQATSIFRAPVKPCSEGNTRYPHPSSSTPREIRRSSRLVYRTNPHLSFR